MFGLTMNKLLCFLSNCDVIGQNVFAWPRKCHCKVQILLQFKCLILVTCFTRLEVLAHVMCWTVAFATIQNNWVTVLINYKIFRTSSSSNMLETIRRIGICGIGISDLFCQQKTLSAWMQLRARLLLEAKCARECSVLSASCTRFVRSWVHLSFFQTCIRFACNIHL